MLVNSWSFPMPTDKDDKLVIEKWFVTSLLALHACGACVCVHI